VIERYYGPGGGIQFVDDFWTLMIVAAGTAYLIGQWRDSRKRRRAGK
jgi:hypothetical protein